MSLSFQALLYLLLGAALAFGPMFYFGPLWCLWVTIWLLAGWAFAGLIFRPSSSSSSDRG